MLTDSSLRDLLGAGYETSDADFVAHMVEHMSRTVYLMAQFLAERQYRFINSVDLQRRVDDHLRTSDFKPTKKFNPVHWFSEQWSLALERRPTTSFFVDEYLELFDREGKSPTSYRIKP